MTETFTKAERLAEIVHAEATMRRFEHNVLYTHTHHGRGETDYVRVYVATDEDEILDVSYFVARVIGARMTPDGVAKRGVGLNNALEVVDCVSWALYDHGQDQAKWRELH